MSNLSEDNILEKLKKNPDSFNSETRGILVRNCSLEIVCQIAIMEEYNGVIKVILERLEKEDIEVIKKYFQKLSKAKSYEIRNFTVKIAPIEFIVEMALNEYDKRVARNILKILEAEDREVVKIYSQKLFKAKSIRIRIFALKIVTIEIFSKLELTEHESEVVNNIFKKLEFEDVENIKGIYPNYKGYEPEFLGFFKEYNSIIESTSMDRLIELATSERDKEKAETIAEKLLNKSEDISYRYFEKLFNAKSLVIFNILEVLTPIEFVIEEVLTEKEIEIIKNIFKKLEVEDEKNVKEYYKEISKVKSPKIRNLVVENVSIETLLEMALIETNGTVSESIAKRLVREAENIPANYYKKLCEVKSSIIRSYVVKIIPQEFLIEMALVEEKNIVLSNISTRLKNEKNNEVIKDILLKRSKPCSYFYYDFPFYDAIKELETEELFYILSHNNEGNIVKYIIDILSERELPLDYWIKILDLKSFEITKCVVEKAPFEVVCEIVTNSNYMYFGNLEYRSIPYYLLERLESEDVQTIIKYANKLTHTKSNLILEFIIEILPIENVVELILSEGVYSDNVMEKLFKRLNNLKDEEILRNISHKIINTNFSFISDNSFKLRIFAIKYAPLEDVIKTAIKIEWLKIIYSIIERLKQENVEEVKMLWKKYDKTEFAKIRILALETLEYDLAIDFILIKEKMDNLKDIFELYKNK